jgi:hypothetical protein
VLETGRLYSKTRNSCSIIGHPWTSKIGQSYVSNDITLKFFFSYLPSLFRVSTGSEHTSQTHTNSTTRMPRPTSPLGSVPASQTGNRSLRKREARNAAHLRRKRTELYERDMRSMERSGLRSSRTPFSKIRNAGRRI